MLESDRLAHLVTLNPDGSPQVTCVWVGLEGDEIVSGHLGTRQKVRNIERDPRVRVKVGRRWHEGTAHVLDDDDPRARLRWLKRPLNDAGLLLMASEMLVVRVDLDR